MSKILVGYVSKSLNDGISSYLFNCPDLANKGPIDLLAVDEVNNKTLREKKIKIDNCFTVPRNRHFIKRFKLLRRIYKENSYDIAYFNISETYNCVDILAAKLSGVKTIIVHAHSSNAQGKLKIAKRILNRACKLILMFSCTNYCACSEKAAKWLLPKDVFETGAYDLIYSKLDFTKWKFNAQNREKIRKKYNINDATVLGFVGGIRRDKNYKFLLRTLKVLTKKGGNYKLLCVGGGETSILMKYAKRLGVENNVVLCPPTTNVEEFYPAFDVFLLPSKVEGLPISALEAQVSGCPTLLSEEITSETVIGKNTQLLALNKKVWAAKIKSISDRSNKLLPSSDKFNVAVKDGNSLFESKNTPHRWENYLLNLAICLLIVHYAINLTSYLNGISTIGVVGSALCGILALFFFIKNRSKISKNKFLLILLSFVVDYVLTLLLTKRYDLASGIKWLIWMLVLFAFVYPNKAFLKNTAAKYGASKELKFFIASMTILNIVNFVLLTTGTETVIESATGVPYIFGMSPWGRFYGIFYDPNYASIASGVAIVFALYLINKEESLLSKLLYFSSIFFQLLYIIVCQSRSGLLSLLFGCFVLLLMFVVSNIKNRRKFETRKIVSLAVFLAVLGGLICSTIGIASRIYDEKHNQTAESSITPSTIVATAPVVVDATIPVASEEAKTEEAPSNDSGNRNSGGILNRSDAQDGDISNRRFDIWKSFLQVYVNSGNYLLGVGPSNIVGYAEENLPDTYIISNGFTKFDVAHNTAIDILLSQGIIGVVIAIILIVYEFKTILAAKIFKRRKSDCYYIVICISALSVIMFSSMFLTEIVYVNNLCTFLFWLSLGYLNNVLLRKERNG